ncbi:hypothetical protein CMK18_17020 [Candidatus Poribacteria bacterium]|nr:hypothetical protein [Candidatus Poribacteria bacterium]
MEVIRTDFNSLGREFFYSLLKKDKQMKDYLIITLGVLVVGLFLYSCGSYMGTLPETDPDLENIRQTPEYQQLINSY